MEKEIKITFDNTSTAYHRLIKSGITIKEVWYAPNITMYYWDEPPDKVNQWCFKLFKDGIEGILYVCPKITEPLLHDKNNAMDAAAIVERNIHNIFYRGQYDGLPKFNMVDIQERSLINS